MSTSATSFTFTNPPGPEARKTGLSGNREAVLRVIWITLLLNLVNVVIKFAVGFWTANMTVLADAVHSSIDAANNVLGIFTLKLAYRPPDSNHPYGHRKFEAVASLAIGGMMALTSWEILKSNFHQLMLLVNHAPRELAVYSPVGMLLIVFGFALNVFVTVYEYRRGRALASPFLVADAMHTRSDLFVTALSFSSLLLAPRWPMFDVGLSFIIILLILRSGWRVIQENLLLLTDATQLDPEPIRKIAEGVDGVENCHAIRTHGMPDEVHLDLHIVIPAEVTALDAQKIESKVRDSLLQAFPAVVEVAIHHQVHQPGTGQPIRRPE